MTIPTKKAGAQIGLAKYFHALDIMIVLLWALAKSVFASVGLGLIALLIARTIVGGAL